jgi:hypothetical protein
MFVRRGPSKTAAAPRRWRGFVRSTTRIVLAAGSVAVISLLLSGAQPSPQYPSASFVTATDRGLLDVLPSMLGLIPSAFAGKGGNGNGGGNGNAGGNGNGNAGGSNAGGNGNGSANSNAGGVGKAKGKTSASSSDSTSTTTDQSESVASGTITASGVTSSGGHDILSNEIVVVDAETDSLDRIRQLGFGLIEQRSLPALGLSLLRLRTPGNVDSQRGLVLLRTAMPQLVADVNSLYQPYAGQGGQTASTELASLPAGNYAWRMIGWSDAPDCGAGVRIGLIDSAISAEAPLFDVDKIHRSSFAESGEDDPDTRHGTAIASLLVGQGGDPAHPHWQGLLPSADLYAAAVFQRRGSRSMASAVAIAGALDWMVASRVPVINISLSGEPNLLMAAAIERAARHGAVLVAAAGNGGPTAPPAYPAAYRDVISVTAVDQSTAIFEEANRGDYIAFAAPGVRIWAPGGGSFGQYLTGTSFATPFVAAMATLTITHGGALSSEAIRQELAAHALHLGAPGKNPIYGYGLLKAPSSCGVADFSASSL